MGPGSSPKTWMQKSVKSSRSSASSSSTARRKKPPTISSKNFEPPSQPTPPPRRHKPSTWRLPHNKEEHNESAYHTHSDHDGSIVLRNCPFVWPLSLRLRM